MDTSCGSHAPLSATPSAVTACPALRSPSSTVRAERTLTTCSTLRPPKTRPTFMRTLRGRTETNGAAQCLTQNPREAREIPIAQLAAASSVAQHPPMRVLALLLLTTTMTPPADTPREPSRGVRLAGLSESVPELFLKIVNDKLRGRIDAGTIRYD